MYISRLALDHFRSWSHCVLDLADGVTILHGPNGTGKTNLVEAVEVLSTGASHRASSLRPCIARGETRAAVRANVEDAGRTVTYEATLAARGANRGRIGGGPSVYLRDVVGRIPSVVFAPEDQRLVQGEPAARRTFLDQAGTLLSPGYAELAQSVSHIARQRAALLRRLSERGTSAAPDAALAGLEAWTGQFVDRGLALTRARAQVVGLLAPRFSALVADLSGGAGHATLEYAPSFAEAFGDADPAQAVSAHFRRLYAGEVARGVNLIGPQRDDLALGLDGMPAREYASNGEMWTMALALRMALSGAVTELTGVRPVTILDDVFAQLDDRRRAQILDFARGQDQVLLTVAAPGDVPADAAKGAALVDVAALASRDMFAPPAPAAVPQSAGGEGAGRGPSDG